ncbi:MAG: hypothetical protein NC336_09050 [Clostridium sp.]|nr:hypothetical protein [Clostridium sp.]
MRFSDIPGQEDVKQRLRNLADSGRIPHALLLEGPAGAGKLALARAFAAYLHCANPTAEGDSCGQCQSCRLHQSLNHIDTLWSFPVVKRNPAPKPNTSEDFIDDWREFLAESIYPDSERWSEILNRSKTNTKPVIYVDESDLLIRRLAYTTHGNRYKIVIMWLPERLNDAAANKLLKLVEEPFPDTLFLMVSDQPALILPTIYSRAQRIKVNPPDPESAARWLVEGYDNLPLEEALDIVRISGGNMVQAVHNLASNSSRKAHFERFKSLMRLAYTRDVARLRDWAADLAADGRDKEMTFYEFAMRQVRENFIYNFGQPTLNALTTEEEEFSRNFARFITERNAISLMKLFDEALNDIAANTNAKMVNFDVAIKTILLIKNG